jgi:hypothetical protein
MIYSECVIRAKDLGWADQPARASVRFVRRTVASAQRLNEPRLPTRREETMRAREMLRGPAEPDCGEPPLRPRDRNGVVDLQPRQVEAIFRGRLVTRVGVRVFVAHGGKDINRSQPDLQTAARADHL